MFLPCFLLLLSTPVFSLPILPEVFSTHPLTHPNFSSLSITSFALHSSGDIFVTGVAHNYVSSNTSSLSNTAPLPYIARLNHSASFDSFSILNSTGTTNPTALLLHSDHLYIAGTTTGTVHNGIRNTPNGTPSIFLTKLNTRLRQVWLKPLIFGSKGHDSLSCMNVDVSNRNSAVFLTGSVGGDAFPAALRIGNEKTDGSGNRKDGEADTFVGRVEADSGSFSAVQMKLEGGNSGDAMAVGNGKIFVIVNSYTAAPFDANGKSELVVFDGGSLKIRSVEKNGGNGEYGMGLARDGRGGLYCAGFVMNGQDMRDGKYVVRKMREDNSSMDWERVVGRFSRVEPRMRIAVGKKSGMVYVVGYGKGEYESEEGSGGLVRMPVGVWNGEGDQLMEWGRTSLFPNGFEEIREIGLDKSENMIYVGRWLNERNGMYDATVGSLGTAVVRSRSVDEKQGSAEKKNGIGGWMIGVILMTLVLGVGFVIVIARFGRLKWLERKGLVYEESGEEEIWEMEEKETRRGGRGGGGDDGIMAGGSSFPMFV